jgi:uncharacterized protein YdeI (YjbR/CyaY-like superfamily)
MPMPKARKDASTVAVQRFPARLERLRSRLNWIIIHIPFDTAEVWGLRGQIKVRGEINGFAFRTSLFPTRERRHILLVNKRMQKGARAFEGTTAHFQMELDTEERIVTIPGELKRIFAEDRQLRHWYDALNHSTRGDTSKWIAEPKSAAARLRRAAQIAERLLSVMDAERELPPILRIAFARHPRALEGWEAMSVARRRGHLFGIFYYRTPDAQARRIDKMLADAADFAEKLSGKRSSKKKRTI